MAAQLLGTFIKWFKWVQHVLSLSYAADMSHIGKGAFFQNSQSLDFEFNNILLSLSFIADAIVSYLHQQKQFHSLLVHSLKPVAFYFPFSLKMFQGFVETTQLRSVNHRPPSDSDPEILPLY